MGQAVLQREVLAGVEPRAEKVVPVGTQASMVALGGRVDRQEYRAVGRRAGRAEVERVAPVKPVESVEARSPMLPPTSTSNMTLR